MFRRALNATAQVETKAWVARANTDYARRQPIVFVRVFVKPIVFFPAHLHTAQSNSGPVYSRTGCEISGYKMKFRHTSYTSQIQRGSVPRLFSYAVTNAIYIGQTAHQTACEVPFMGRVGCCAFMCSGCFFCLHALGMQHIEYPVTQTNSTAMQHVAYPATQPNSMAMQHIAYPVTQPNSTDIFCPRVKNKI